MFLVKLLVAPLISLLRGVTLTIIALDSDTSPLLIPLIVNLILPSVSTPVAGTFTVLNEVKSVPPSCVPTL